jgi:hypothetical protein
MPLFVQFFNFGMNLFHSGSSKRIAGKCDSEVISCIHQELFHLAEHIVFDVVKTKIQVLELRIANQVPHLDVCPVLVLLDLRLQVVKHRHGVFWFLLLLLLDVGRDNCIPILQLLLMLCHLLLRKYAPTEVFEERSDILARQIVLGKSNELKCSVDLKHSG